MPISKKQKVSSMSLEELVAQSVKMLDQVAASAIKNQQSLTKAERKKALKMRTGGEKIVPVIADLATRHAVNIGDHPVTAMTKRMDQVKALAPLIKRAQLLVTQLSDASLRANAEAWDTATVLYTTLRRISRKNGDVAAALSEVEDFFAYRHKNAGATSGAKKAKGKAAATTAAEPPPAGPTTEAAPAAPVAAPVAPEPTTPKA
jgi:hypothetical protein